MRDYNFFEFLVEEKKTTELRFVYVGIITSIIVGAMVVTYLVNVFKIRDLENSVYEAQAIVSSPEFTIANKEKNRDSEKLKLLNNYYTSVADLNTSISNEDYINTELIKTISSVVPQNISFQNVSIASRIITMTGAASSRVAIAELQYNLKALGIFEDIYVPNVSSNFQDDASYSFNFNISFKLKEGHDNEK